MNAVPVVLECDAGTSSLKVAGLTVLDRMVVAAHRAGGAPITIIGKPAAAIPRARALGVVPLFAPDAAPADASCLRITGCVLCEARDLRRVIEQRGRLTRRDGTPLPVTMAGETAAPVPAQGVAVEITDAASAREAERQLWASLGSSADGLVDRYFNRPAGRPLSRLLVHTPISPNVVSAISILVGVAAAPFFANASFILGALVLQLSAIIDCVDGELARILYKESRLGKWLDLLGDQVVHFSVFAALGLGVARSDPAMPALALGLSAALGVLLCLPPLLGALRRPAAERPPRLNQLIDAAANRDFSVLLLFLALIGRADLFLWMAGIGIHIFWIALVLMQTSGRARAAPIPR